MQNEQESNLEVESIIIKFLHIQTKFPEDFIDELEEVCLKYADSENYYFNFQSA